MLTNIFSLRTVIFRDLYMSENWFFLVCIHLFVSDKGLFGVIL